MAFSPDYRTYPRASAATTAAVLDAGLRAYMLRVYNWMRRHLQGETKPLEEEPAIR